MKDHPLTASVLKDDGNTTDRPAGNLTPGLDPVELAAKLKKRLPRINDVIELKEGNLRRAREDEEIDVYGFTN